MTPTIGWYLHHHGAGHVTRFLAVRPHLDAEVVVFSSAAPPPVLPDRTRWITLPRDDAPEDGYPTPVFDTPEADGLLHWAPLRHRGYAGRMGAICAELTGADFRAFVVDVSVEITLLIRLLGLPVVVIGQPGTRTDRPHQLAYRAASSIIAPWPALGKRYSDPLSGWAPKVHHVGGISRFDGRDSIGEHRPGNILVLGGGGGATATAADVDAVAAATPELSWSSIGFDRASTRGAQSGWVTDPWPQLCSAEVIVSWAGQNAVADLAAVGRPAIVIPQHRPFDEQRSTARALRSLELAVVSPKWPDSDDWPVLLATAKKSRPEWSRWQVAGAARRAADVILASTE